MRPRQGLDLIALYAIALTVRLTPLLLSPLPYNVDGFAQVALARDIVGESRWALDGASPNAYNLKMPLVPILLATLGELLGVDILPWAQILIPLIAATAVPSAYVLATALGAPRGAAVGTGTFLALSGTFAFLTSAVMKEAVGLALLPVALLLFHGARDGRKRALFILVMVALPFLHSLTLVMTLAFTALAAVVHHVGDYRRHALDLRRAAADAATLIPLSLLAAAYYSWVDMEFFADVARGDELLLLLSVAFVFTLVALAIATGRGGRPLLALGRTGWVNGKGAVVLAAGLLVIANGRRSFFPGTATTSPLLLLVAVAYAALAVVALAGFERTRVGGGAPRRTLTVLLAVPVAAMLFAILRGLDPTSFILLYRSFDYIDLGLAMGVGLAVAGPRKLPSRAALSALVVACLLATLPAAFATQETFGVENVTTPAEFAALAHFASLPGTSRSTDQRYSNALAFYWSVNSEAGLPLDLAEARSPSASLLLASEAWTTEGAQVFPLAPVPIPEGDLGTLVAERNLIYSNTGGLLILSS